MTSFRRHLSYANVMATIAVVIAVAGIPSAVAITTSRVKKNSVGAKQLKKGSVTADKLAPGAVTDAKIADGNVTASKLAGIHLVADNRAPGSGTLATCQAPERLLSGGATTEGGTLSASQPELTSPTVNQWTSAGTGGSASNGYALCLKNTPGT
jgi:hypothetical protein